MQDAHWRICPPGGNEFMFSSLEEPVRAVVKAGWEAAPKTIFPEDWMW